MALLRASLYVRAYRLCNYLHVNSALHAVCGATFKAYLPPFIRDNIIYFIHFFFDG